jgi:putative transposase
MQALAKGGPKIPFKLQARVRTGAPNLRSEFDDSRAETASSRPPMVHRGILALITSENPDTRAELAPLKHLLRRDMRISINLPLHGSKRMSSPRLQTARRSDAGAWYVITMATVDRRSSFTNDLAAAAVRRELTELPEPQAITHAWVLMPDHLHWLLELGYERALSAVVQRMKSRTAIAVNRVTGGSGSVWQAGFFDHRVRSSEDVRVQARYLIENPVRKGLVVHPQDYPHWWCRWIDRNESCTL